MDKATTLAGGIGCRRSTWDDPDVNALIPFSRRLPELHANARTLPRSRDWPRLAHLVDAAVQAAIATARPTAEILRTAQAQAASIRL
jgi:multiple sugar transport system substrate-binding protein